MPETSVYKDDYTTASENLKLVIKFLASHKIPVSPINYQVGYDIISGRNLHLKEALGKLLSSQGQQLTEENFLMLYGQFLLPDGATVEEQKQKLQQLINSLQTGYSNSSDEMTNYIDSLNHFSDVLSDTSDTDKLSVEVNKVKVSTQSIEQSQRLFDSNMSGMMGEINDLREELEQAKEESMTDVLTGLSNRRAFDQMLELLINNDEEKTSVFSIIIADIDFFKMFNDTYGHLIGDKVLIFVSKIIKSCVKGKDMAARFGGEEFILLLPNTNIKGASIVAENLRVAIAGIPLYDKSADQDYGKVTVSLGVSQFHIGEKSEKILERADKALYQAKENGRNRVEIAG